MRAIIIFSTLLLASVEFLNAQDKPNKSSTKLETIKHLQKAYEDEVNTAFKYELFAIKAKAEGFEQAADAFAAAAAAENIHSLNHQEVLAALEYIPEKITFEVVEVKSTRENLEMSINDEGKEEILNYPAYIEEAEEERINEAIESFSYAMKAEKNHKAIFKDAANNLCKVTSQNYYINIETGETVKLPESAPPPQADNESEFIKIDI